MHKSHAPVFRTAHAEEIPLAMTLCTPAPELQGEGPARCFVAVKYRSGECIFGAAFWREIPAEGPTPAGATFEWTMRDELADSPVETDFLIALVTEIQLALPDARWLSPSTDLPEGHPLADRLIQATFQQVATQIHHSATMPDIAAWLDKFPENPAALPATSPHPSHFDPLHEVLCGHDRPLRKSRLSHGFKTAASRAPTLFDSRCSILLMDGETVAAACLANVTQGHLTLAALHLPSPPVQLLPEILRQVISRSNLFAPPLTLGFVLHPQDPPAGLPALLEIPVFKRVGTTRSFRRELHFAG